MAMAAQEIVKSVGMCNNPSNFSGRPATWSDFCGQRLFRIHKKIKEEIGTDEAEAFCTMVENLEYLSATNFLNALYALEARNWVYEPVKNNQICAGPDDTEYIKHNFLYQIGRKSAPQSELDRRFYCSF